MTGCAEQIAWLKHKLVTSRATWQVIAADMPLGLVVGDGTDPSGCPPFTTTLPGALNNPRTFAFPIPRPGRPPGSSQNRATTSGSTASTNDLYITLLNALGASDTEFGDMEFAYRGGAISELLA